MLHFSFKIDVVKKAFVLFEYKESEKSATGKYNTLCEDKLFLDTHL